jgi:hypothetical protein
MGPVSVWVRLPAMIGKVLGTQPNSKIGLALEPMGGGPLRLSYSAHVARRGTVAAA